MGSSARSPSGENRTGTRSSARRPIRDRVIGGRQRARVERLPRRSVDIHPFRLDQDGPCGLVTVWVLAQA